MFDSSGKRHDFENRWAALTPPLRPGPHVAAAMRPFFQDRRGGSLQLGVTPEIALLSNAGLAVDCSEAMVQLAWPGDTSTHQAIVANWLCLPLQDASIGIAFGDGCLSMLSWCDEYLAFFASMQRVLRPTGMLLLRCFCGPDKAEPLAALGAAAFAGGIKNFSAFKLRLNMAAYHLAAGAPNTSAHIHGIFAKNFPDRAKLAQSAGWKEADIDSIDSYRGGKSLHSYPTRGEIAALLPDGVGYEFSETAGYELAERCPLLKVDFSAA